MHSLQFTAGKHQLICHHGHLPPLSPHPPSSTTPSTSQPPKSDLLTRLLHRYPLLHRLELLYSTPTPSSPLLPSLFSSPPPPAYHVVGGLAPLLSSSFLLPLLPSLSLFSLSPSPLSSSVRLHSSHLSLSLDADTAQQIGLPSSPSTPSSHSPLRLLSLPLSPSTYSPTHRLYDRLHTRLLPLPPLHLLVHCPGLEPPWPPGTRARPAPYREERWQADGVGVVDLPAVLDVVSRAPPPVVKGAGKKGREGKGGGDEGGVWAVELMDWVGLTAHRLQELLPSPTSAPTPSPLIDCPLCPSLPLLPAAASLHSLRATGVMTAVEAVDALRVGRGWLGQGGSTWVALCGWGWGVGGEGADEEGNAEADYALFLCSDGRFLAFEARNACLVPS